MGRAFEEDDSPHEKEITLSTSALLAIFFGLVLICGVFFGFGYSTGRRSGQVPAATTATAPSADPTADIASKPSAAGHATSAPAMASLSAAPKPSAADAASDQPEAADAEQPPPPPVNKPLKTAPALTPAPASADKPAQFIPAATNPPPPSAAGAGTPSMVQIAAVSRKEDADVLVAALSKRGYSVVIRNEPQDKLLHIQVGPFASRQEADAIRRKLQADGYNAFIRQ